MKRQEKNHKGITGLETAIVIIAFVVVAAVIAYTVLAAGSP
jgi:flagellin-like protein